MALALLPGQSQSPRILFVEQFSARVGLVVDANVVTVGTVPNVATSGGERGLLGIAIDPSYPARPYLYVHATDARAGGRIAISRFTLTGDLSGSGSGIVTFDAASRYDVVVDLPDAATNHNGGTVRFGPDGMLYASLGDDATGCDAQRVETPVGKILRMDVSHLPAGQGGPSPWSLLTAQGNPYASSPDSSARLVWAMGFRNPFRFHIDPATGDLLVADVGENTWEELDLLAGPGANGGWPWREGPSAYASCTGSPPAFVDPIAYYDHSEGAAIISGGIYRRPAGGPVRFPAEYDGNAFYLDYYGGFVRRLVPTGPDWSPALPPVPGQPSALDWAVGFQSVSDMIELPDGSLVYVRQSVNYASGTGEIRRIAYPQTTDVPSGIPAALAFSPPRPSPSRGPVTLRWSQPEAAPARLTVHDVEGRLIRTLASGETLSAGVHERVWDGRGAGATPLPPGLYFVRLQVRSDVRTARVIRIR